MTVPFHPKISLAGAPFSDTLRSMSLFEPHTPDLNEPPKNKGGSKFAEDELTVLAHNANRYIKWPGLDDDSDNSINHRMRLKAQAIALANGRTDGLRNVYRMGGGSRSSNFIVKISICGRSFRIHIGPDRKRSARYADAAILYFWKYRNTDRQPEDADFNTSLAVARELVAFPQCAIQLQILEDFLLRSGQIHPPNLPAVETRVRSFTRDLRVARKYLERSRRYLRMLRENYALPPDKLDAIDLMGNELTLMLDNFSATLQAGADDVIAQMRVEANQQPPAVKSDLDLLFEQQTLKAQAERESNQ